MPMTAAERTVTRVQRACDKCLIPALRGEGSTHQYALFNAHLCNDCLEILATVIGLMVLPTRSESEHTKDMQVQCCRCKGSGKEERSAGDPTDSTALRLVDCGVCNGFGVVIATGLKAVSKWTPV